MLVALGVTGGIAAYKACEIVRGLTKAGAEVQVLLTANAERFVTPLTLQTLSGRRVMTSAWDLSDNEGVQHVDLSKSIAAFVIAPATANAIAKFAQGVADDLLSTFYITVTAPVVVAPAMNTRMWLHPTTQRNVATLRSHGVTLVDPDSGWLAEREHGWGRLAEPDSIVTATLAAARRSTELAGKIIVVSAGPTREAIDPVRFVSNRSSGRMGYALAAAAARRGARVILVSGPVAMPTPFGVERIDVTTALEMREAVLRSRQGAFAVIMAAAVADHAPRAAEAKIKKTGQPMTLVLDEGPDILAELGQSKGREILIGFAAETEDLVGNAAKKLAAKGADFIVANDVATKGRGFDSDRNAVTILSRDGGVHSIAEASKAEIAEAILDRTLGAAERS